LRILLYSQFCTPEPIFKSVPFALELRNRGHEVRILTGFPNYPGGSVYPGYRLRLRQDEVIDGVPVKRTWLYPSHNQSGLGRIANYLSFATSSAPSVLNGWKPDLVYVYNLPTLAAVAAISRLVHGTPYVVDLQDIWPESIARSRLGSVWMLGPVRMLCHFAYKRAARLVVLSPGFAQAMINRGIPKEKIKVIYNWCDESSLANDSSASEFPEEAIFRSRFNILFAGNMGIVQGLKSVIDAAAITERSHPQIQFVFMGGGVMLEELIKYAAFVAPRSTAFLSSRSSMKASSVLKKADVLLLHLQDDPLFSITIPSKTQAYLAIGKPILAGIRGDAANLIKSAKAGEVCEPDNPVSIADTAIRLSTLDEHAMKRLGENGSSFYKRELSLAVGVDSFEKLFDEVLKLSKGK
jgi:colanic acid biosynthesis glycosyl transferase WcaI